MNAAPLDLVRDVLDRQLLDADGYPCGMVDDVELEEDAGGLRVVGLLVGAGAWVPRLPALLQPAARKLFGARLVRVPWSQIDYVREHIRLKSAAEKLGLVFPEPFLQRVIAWIPGNEKTEPD